MTETHLKIKSLFEEYLAENDKFENGGVKAAAARAAVLLWNKSEKLPETQAYVNELVCTGCGQCVQVCPFNAISLNPDSGIATVDESLCRGCGTCAGTCRVSAITTKSYSDLQMLSLLNSI